MRIAEQFGTWISDTGLTFAPIFYGTPIAGIATLFTAAIGTGLFTRPEKPDPDLVILPSTADQIPENAPLS